MSSAVVNATETLSSHPRVGLLASPATRTFLFGLVLAFITVAAYYPVHGNPFVNFDDHDYVTENQHVLKGLSWSTIKWAFTTFHAGNWHPLTWLSHAR